MEEQSERVSEKPPSPTFHSLPPIGQRVKRICPSCGEEFETANLGSGTRRYCFKCAEEKTKELEEKEQIALRMLEESRYQQMVRIARIPPKWRDVTFENSNPGLNPGMFKLAKKYAEKFTTKSQGLVLYSPGNGTGKTHLAACIANYVLHELRQSVMFEKARDLMLDIRRTFSDKDDTEADVLDRVLSVGLLILDDVGVDPPSEWIKGTYWTVFDRRLEWELPVVVTTNKPLEAPVGQECLADRIGEGATSRLLGLCQGNVIDMTGLDLR